MPPEFAATNGSTRTEDPLSLDPANAPLSARDEGARQITQAEAFHDTAFRRQTKNALIAARSVPFLRGNQAQVATTKAFPHQFATWVKHGQILGSGFYRELVEFICCFRLCVRVGQRPRRTRKPRVHTSWYRTIRNPAGGGGRRGRAQCRNVPEDVTTPLASRC
jgi:hypothetical protein